MSALTSTNSHRQRQSSCSTLPTSMSLSQPQWVLCSCWASLNFFKMMGSIFYLLHYLLMKYLKYKYLDDLIILLFYFIELKIMSKIAIFPKYAFFPMTAVFVVRNTWVNCSVRLRPSNCANCLSRGVYVSSVCLLETLIFCQKTVSWVSGAFLGSLSAQCICWKFIVNQFLEILVGHWNKTLTIRMGNSVFCYNTSFWVGVFFGERVKW